MTTTQLPETPRPAQRRYSPPKNPWAIVTRREIFAKLTDKAFVTGTLLSLVLLIVGTGIGAVVGNAGTKAQIAVVDEDAKALVASADQVAKAENAKSQFDAVEVADEKSGRDKVASGDVDALLLHKDGAWQMVFHKKSDPGITSVLRQTLQATTTSQLAQKTGVSQDDLARMSTIHTTLVDGGEDRALVGFLASAVFGILFFMSAITFGMQIATSVVEEKSSRIVEIISAAIPVRHLLAGKVLGNTVMAFAQMALLAIAGLAAVGFTSFKGMLPLLSGAVVWYLLYFVAGFLALACVWAVAGSLAARNEDLQQTTMPLMMVLFVPYMAGFLAKGVWVQVLSYVPVVSAVLMPARVVAGDAALWEVLTGLVINLVFAAVTVVIGEKLYRRTLLQTQGTLTYRQAFKLRD